MQSQRIILTQKQQLKLSPQMYQSLELLALPIQDLQARIQDEIERNPALELSDAKDLSYESYTGSSETHTYDYFENSSDAGYIRKASHIDTDSKHQFMEGALYRSESLQEHLQQQLRLQPLSEADCELGTLIISNLDDHGFHREDPHQIVPEGTSVEELERVLSVIQSFDPPGIAVADYTESLLLQCDLDEQSHPLAKQIITSFLEHIKRGKLETIAKELDTDVEEIQEAVSYIQTLNPYPGSIFAGSEIQYVTPDLTIWKVDHSLQMQLNSDQIPILSIDPVFEDMMEDPTLDKDKETRKYIQNSIKDAQWLINSIDMRNSTLQKVGAALIKFQYDFFLNGPKYLRALTLKDVAEEVSVHETTISRISHAKYIQTDWGIFPIKYFFTNAVTGTSDDGKEVSKTGVKEVMKEIIEGYEGTRRLSDQKISTMLAERGISIARRTVAKYRKELNIDSSFHRS